MKAFENRLKKNKRWVNCKPNRATVLLEKLDNEFEEWTCYNTRKQMITFANDYFTSNITDPDIQKDPRN